MRASLAVRTAATAATAGAVGLNVWNPHATMRPRVYEIAWIKTVATVDSVALVRSSARGTQSSFLTSSIDNETDRVLQPPSGLVMDFGWSVAPTVNTANPLYRWTLPANIGAGFVLPMPEEWEIPPGTGLALITPVATILQPADVTFRWAE